MMEFRLYEDSTKVQSGGVVQVYRKKYAVSIEWVQGEKGNGPTVCVSIHLTRLKLDKDCSKKNQVRKSWNRKPSLAKVERKRAVQGRKY